MGNLLLQYEASALLYIRTALPELKDQDIRNQLGAFGIKGDMALRPLRSLSGGQCVRTALARICIERPHLLVLDEPTNHLDIYSIDALTSALKEFCGGVILVTHNRSMLEAVAEEFVVLRKDAQCIRPVGAVPLCCDSS